MKSLDKLIEQKIYEVLDRIGIEASDYGEIVIDENQNIGVKLTNNKTIYGLKNKTGETLSANDKVKIYGSRSNLSNRYIGVKL